MLDPALSSQLKTHLEKLTQPIVLVASTDDGAKSTELLELLDEIASLSDQITVERDGSTGDEGSDRRPSFDIVRAGTDVKVAFAGSKIGTSAVTPPTPPPRSSSRCATSRASTTSRPTSRCRVRTAPTSSRRST